MKKLTAFLFAITMVFTSTACAGKKKSEEKESPASISVTQTTYGVEEIFLNDLIDVNYIQHIAPYDGGICLFYSSIDGKCKFARTDAEFNIKASAEISDKETGSSYYVHDDGSFDIVAADTDFEFEYDENMTITNYDKYLAEAEFTFWLLSYDSEGNIVNQCDIEDAGNYYDTEISGMCELVPYGEDNLMLNFGSGLVLFDRSGNVIDIDVGSQYDQCHITSVPDGRILFTQHSSYGYMKPDSVAAPSDMKENKQLINSFSAPVKGSGDFPVYFNMPDGLYGMTESEEIILVVDYDKSLMTSTSGSIIPYGDGKFIMNGNANKIMVYTRRPDGYVEKRKALDLWMIDCGGTTMHNTATDFCAVNDQYYINVTEGVSFDDVPAAVLSGDGPDLIYYGNSGDMFKLVNMGALADLTPYLDSGTGLSRDEILPNILEAYEYKGGIYTLSEAFCVQLITAKKDFIGDEYRCWSIDDFLEIYDNRPEGMRVFDQKYISTILCNEDIWIDRENNTCNYDSDEFIRILEICKEEESYPEIDYNDPEDVKMQMSIFKDNKAMLGAQTTNLPSLQHLFDYLGECGLTLEDTSLLNLPGKEKGMISFLNNYSIMADSDCQEGAWEFISYVLNEERQQDGSFFLQPITTKAFEKSMQGFIDPPGGRKTMTGDHNGIKYTSEISASEDQVMRYYDFVKNCTTLSYSDRDVDDIFFEEYNRFISDEITTEECANNLQNRIGLYLAETS